MNAEFSSTCTEVLETMAIGLRNDCKALQHHHRGEALKLFRLWQRIQAELNYRELARLVGHTVNVRFESIKVQCRILDSRKVWNRIDVEIVPTCGKGTQWVSVDRIELPASYGEGIIVR